MEVLYLSEKGRIPINLGSVRNLLAKGDNYQVVPVGMDVVATASQIDDVPELHDRLIVATAKWLGVAILTSDPAISASKHAETIWR
jgi:PIN domain nuclease of toxin-antitoxin system